MLFRKARHLSGRGNSVSRLNSRPPRLAVRMVASKMATRKENTLPSIGLRHCRSIPWRCSDHLFMCPRKNNGADHFWNYPDLCPEDLIRSFHLKPDSINQDELLRAEWFWRRRPKVLCANLISLFSYILVLVCLLYFLPECAPALLVWLVVGTSGVLVDCLRLDRWGGGIRTQC